MKWLTTARNWAAVLGCLLLVTAAGWADSHARIVRLSYVQGAVDINRGQGVGFERAIPNMPVVEGAQVWTREDSVAEVEFEDGSTVRLAPGSRLDFTALSLRDSGARVTTLGLSEGVAYVDVPHLEKGDEFTLQFPNRDLAVTRPVRFRVEVDGAEARLAVFKGVLEMTGSERAISVKKNETIRLDLSDANRYDLADSIESFSYDGWNNERAKVHDDYFSSAGQSGYAPGLASLSYYGSFFPLDGCGNGWRPFGAGLGWDPWASGAWMWYPGQGYVWVSNYPWGWTPYRYGSWTFMSGTGWSWCSQGNRWDTWNTIPVILTAPTNFVRPHPPLTIPTGNGTTIWVGKGGPGEREGSLGNSLVGDRTGGRGRSSNPTANNTVVFRSGPATGAGGAGTAPSDASGRGNRQSDPRWQQAPASRSDAGRSNQAPASRSDSGRSIQAPPSRSESPRYSPSPQPPMHSAPAPAPRMESPRMEAPRSAPPAASPPAAPAAGSHPKQ